MRRDHLTDPGAPPPEEGDGMRKAVPGDLGLGTISDFKGSMMKGEASGEIVRGYFSTWAAQP